MNILRRDFFGALFAAPFAAKSAVDKFVPDMTKAGTWSVPWSEPIENPQPDAEEIFESTSTTTYAQRQAEHWKNTFKQLIGRSTVRHRMEYLEYKNENQFTVLPEVSVLRSVSPLRKLEISQRIGYMRKYEYELEKAKGRAYTNYYDPEDRIKDSPKKAYKLPPRLRR